MLHAISTKRAPACCLGGLCSDYQSVGMAYPRPKSLLQMEYQQVHDLERDLLTVSTEIIILASQSLFLTRVSPSSTGGLVKELPDGAFRGLLLQFYLRPGI